MGLLSFATIHGFNNWLQNNGSKWMSLKNGWIYCCNPYCYEHSIPSCVSWSGTIRARGVSLSLTSSLTILTPHGHCDFFWILQLAALITYGIVQSSYIPILTLILMDTPEVESRFLGAAAGMFFCVAEVGGFSGPLMMGALVDATGTFLAGTLFCAFLNLVIIGLTFSLGTRHSTG
jgi:cyanate permease